MRKFDSAQRKGVFAGINASKGKSIVTIFTLCHFFFANFAWSAQIVIDGKTQTSLSSHNNITDVSTSTVRGNTGFNSFSTFNVDLNDVVNLHLPGVTTNLMNLVHSERTTINGILNSIKNGQIGGNVYFANPHGIIVGGQGVVNVGALTLMTPTQSFMDNFFDVSGNPDPSSIAQLQDGSAPMAGDGLISIEGKVNAIGSIGLRASDINASGSIATGAAFGGTAVDFSDVVNDNDLLSGAKVEVVGGDVYIRAENDVTLAGTVVANGVGAGNDAGEIEISAENITLNSGTRVLAYNDAAASLGGDIVISASDATDQDSIAVVDTTNATVSITEATLRGSSVEVTAESTMTAKAEGVPVELAVDAALVDATSKASIELIDSSITTESGSLTVSATSILKADAKASASSTLLPVSGDAAVATSIVDSSAVAHIGGDKTKLDLAGKLDLSSSNKVTVNTTADGSAGGDFAAGGSAAVTVVKRSESKAYIDGNAELIKQADIDVSADSLNNIQTIAKSTSKGATDNSTDTKNNLDKYGPETTETDDQGSSKVTLAGALAVTDLANANTEAYVDLTTRDGVDAQTDMGTLTIASKSLSNASARADAAATRGDTGVGVAVAVNIGNENNRAYIGGSSDISASGINVTAAMQDDTSSGGDADTTSSYSADAMSGTGSKSVGVAGALGLNVAVNTTEAAIRTGANVVAGGDMTLASTNNTESSVSAAPTVKNPGASEPATVGVGASLGTNVAVNTTTSAIEDSAVVTGAGVVVIAAAADHKMETKVEGGSSGSKISMTPLVAVSTAVNTTAAKLGTGRVIDVGSLNVSATHESDVTTEAKGQTTGDDIAIGASLGLTTAVDTVVATTERDIIATGDVAFNAESNATSSTTATASAKGGKKADANGNAEAGGSVDEQIATQKTASNNAAAAGGDKATDELAKADTKTADNDPKAETSEGAVSVAAGIAANIGVNTTESSIGSGRTITSTGGKVALSTINQTDTSAIADGSQVDGGSTDVGVGAAVALNVGVGTNTAVVKDNTDIDSVGLTLSARTNADGADTETSSSEAKATSGAGAANVGVAGSLGLNVAVNTTTATIAGDTDGNSAFTDVNAGGGAVTLETQNNTEANVESKAVVKNSGGDEPAAVGVGASVGLNVAVNTTTSTVSDDVVLTHAGDTTISAASDHKIDTSVEGGASGSKISITPLAAVTTAVNTTTATIGRGAELDVASLNVSATNNSAVTTEAKGQTAGDSIAIGA